jgi:hypothetical protein
MATEEGPFSGWDSYGFVAENTIYPLAIIDDEFTIGQQSGQNYLGAMRVTVSFCCPYKGVTVPAQVCSQIEIHAKHFYHQLAFAGVFVKCTSQL